MARELGWLVWLAPPSSPSSFHFSFHSTPPCLSLPFHTHAHLTKRTYTHTHTHTLSLSPFSPVQVRNWKRRLFLLTSQGFLVYAKDQASINQPLGSLHVRHIREIKPANEVRHAFLPSLVRAILAHSLKLHKHIRSLLHMRILPPPTGLQYQPTSASGPWPAAPKAPAERHALRSSQQRETFGWSLTRSMKHAPGSTRSVASACSSACSFVL